MADSSQIAMPAGFSLSGGGDHTEEFYLNMGPQHPSTHGVLRLVLRMDGETVKEVVPHLGYIHRSIEKMAESQTYVQGIHLTDRMDYLSSFMNNLAVCLAVETGAGIGVPERAEYIRVLVCELQRIQSHLLWWGCFAMDLGALSAFLYGFEEREKITDIFEGLCGARLTMNYFRPGGCAVDLQEDFVTRTQVVVDRIDGVLDEYEGLVSKNLIIEERTKGVGVLPREAALSYGCSGAVGRASGVDYDVRRDDPYGIYDRFSFDVPLGRNGDCYDRYWIRLEEMRQSARIIRQALKELPEGPYRSKEKPVYKLPKNSRVYRQVETARGLFGVLAVSDSGKTPYRMKYRSPGFSNVAAINTMAAGSKLADVVTILATLDPVIPDIDR